MAYGLHSNNRADYLFLSRLGVDMWEMYPARFIALLEQLLTDGMDDEQRKDWQAEMCAVDTVDESNPMLEEMVRFKQAATIADAAELLRLGEQLHRAEESGNEARARDIQQDMMKIRNDAMVAAATGDSAA